MKPLKEYNACRELKQLCDFNPNFDKCETHTAMGCQCHLTGLKPSAAACSAPAPPLASSSAPRPRGAPGSASCHMAAAAPAKLMRTPTTIPNTILTTTPSHRPGEEPAAAAEADANNVMRWAHLICPADGPDPVWRHTPRDALKRSVGMCFSDHVLSNETAAARQQ